MLIAFSKVFIKTPGKGQEEPPVSLVFFLSDMQTIMSFPFSFMAEVGQHPSPSSARLYAYMYMFASQRTTLDVIPQEVSPSLFLETGSPRGMGLIRSTRLVGS